MRSIEQAFDLHPRGYARAGARAPRTAGTLATRPHLRPRPVAAPARTHAPALHLTRRGRVVVVLTVLAALMVAGFTLGRVSSQAAGPARPLPTVTVAPGDTLWTIAARVAPRKDARVVVAEIESLNHLGDGRVRAGQQLRLPR